MTLSDMHHYSMADEVHELRTGIDHEYEFIDKYSKPYEMPHPEDGHQKLASTGDYQFTQCAAYVSITNDNQAQQDEDTEMSPSLDTATSDGGELENTGIYQNSDEL